MNNSEGLVSGKRRSFAQRVGQKGENAFRVFAERHGLLPTKVEQDYGIDFVFQVDLDPMSKHASDIANTFAGACVRATQSKGGNVALTRADAANLLNSQSPLVFCLVHFDKAFEVATHYHRILDEAFVSSLQAFLSGDAETMSVGPTDCSAEAAFESDLQCLLSPSFRERVALAVAQADITTVLPESTVSIQRTADGSLTVVSNFDLFAVFEQFDETQRRNLLQAAFGSDEHLRDRLARLSMRPELMTFLTRLPQPILLSGYTDEAEAVLEAELANEHAQARFLYRRIGSHYAYVHPTGISLIVSKAVERDGVMMHDTEVAFDPFVDVALEDLGELSDFLELCRAGARITTVEDESAIAFNVADWFQPLEDIAAFIAGWRVCAAVDGWPGHSIDLKDVQNAEVFYTVVGFARLLQDPNAIASSSFVLEDALETGDDDLLEARINVLVPIVGNLSRLSVVLELEVATVVAAVDDDVRRVTFESTETARFEARELVAKSTIYPELVLGQAFPTFAFAEGRPEGELPVEMQDLRIAWASEG